MFFVTLYPNKQPSAGGGDGFALQELLRDAAAPAFMDRASPRSAAPKLDALAARVRRLPRDVAAVLLGDMHTLAAASPNTAAELRAVEVRGGLVEMALYAKKAEMRMKRMFLKEKLRMTPQRPCWVACTTFPPRWRNRALEKASEALCDAMLRKGLLLKKKES